MYKSYRPGTLFGMAGASIAYYKDNAYGGKPWFAAENVDYVCVDPTWAVQCEHELYTFTKSMALAATDWKVCPGFDQIVKTVISVFFSALQILETSIYLALTPLLLVVALCERCCFIPGMYSYLFMSLIQITAIAEMFIQIPGHFIKPCIKPCTK